MRESKLNFVVDDQEAVTAFLDGRQAAGPVLTIDVSLPTDRSVLALKDGRAVALAYCALSPENDAAHATVVAVPGYGGYAVKALLHLKTMGLARHWQSTLQAPSPATLAMSRRYFDVTLDHATWEIANQLGEVGPSGPNLYPVALVVSRSFLSLHGLPMLSKWAVAERSQLLAMAADPSRGVLTSPAGFDLRATEVMTLAFELLNLPAQMRQQITRIMLLCAAAARGQDVLGLVGNDMRAHALSTFCSMTAPYRGQDLDGGLFGVRPMNADLLKQAFLEFARKAGQPDRLPINGSAGSQRRARRPAVGRYGRNGGRDGWFRLRSGS